MNIKYSLLSNDDTPNVSSSLANKNVILTILKQLHAADKDYLFTVQEWDEDSETLLSQMNGEEWFKQNNPE